MVTLVRAEPETPVRAGPRTPDRPGPVFFDGQLRGFARARPVFSLGSSQELPWAIPGGIVRCLFGDNAVSPVRSGPARAGPTEGRPL
jgi:hypothetical protein